MFESFSLAGIDEQLCIPLAWIQVVETGGVLIAAGIITAVFFVLLRDPSIVLARSLDLI